MGLVIDCDEFDAPYMSLVWKDDELIGETTSGAWGYRVNAALAIAMIRSDLAEPGTRVTVEIFGSRYDAEVRDLPFWDPKNERIRA